MEWLIGESRALCQSSATPNIVTCYKMSRDTNTRIIFIQDSLNYMVAAVVLVYLCLLLRNSFPKPRKCVQNER